MNKTYYDKNTNLEWQVGPDKNIDWYEANDWIDSLGDSWRMPTIEEYKTIYKAGLGKRNIPPELETTGWYGWSDKEEDDGYAWDFHFYSGEEYLDPRNDSDDGRGFAVRSPRGVFDNLKTWLRNLKRKIIQLVKYIPIRQGIQTKINMDWK